MGIKTKTGPIAPPRPGQRKRIPNTRSSAKQSNQQTKGEIATLIDKSEKRCLNAAQLSDDRLEIIATIDFKPLTSGGNKTLAGKMFDLRLTERSADLESVVQTLSNLQQSNPDAFTTAVNSYNSALVGTEADIALLKMLLLLEKYASHATRFEPFINEYETPSGLDLRFLGFDNLDILKDALSVDITKISGKATQILLQVCSALNCATFGVSPYLLTDEAVSDPRTNDVITKLDASISPFLETMYDIAYISRDLTFSREVTRIRDDAEPNAEFKKLFEDAYGKSFITSARAVNDPILTAITGLNAFGSMQSLGLTRQTSIAGISVNSAFKANEGIASKLLHKSKVLLPESAETEYGRTKYQTIAAVANKSFFGPKPLDFTEFSGAIDAMTDQIRNSVQLGKNSFRVGSAASESDGAAVSPPIASDEQPLSMAAVTSVILDTFERRFASKAASSLTTKFYDWLTPDHVNYTQMIAWLLIRDKPDVAKKIVRAVIEDYEAGHLTAAGIPTPIEGTAEVDSEGNEVPGTEELSPIVNVKPGTDSRVILTGTGTRLNSRIYLVNKYFDEEVPQMSPGATLSTYKSEEVSFPPVRTNYDLTTSDLFNVFGSANFSRSDPDLRPINTIFATREYVVGGMLESSTKFYLSSKIITAEIADCVLEVLRELVSAFAEVPAVEDGDPTFPFIDQFAGPYGVDTSTWGYSGTGYESFSFDKWVPTISTAQEIFTRPTDKVTYFRGVKIEKICERIVDVFAYLMTSYNFLQLQKETIVDSKIELKIEGGFKQTLLIPVCANIKYVPTAGIKPLRVAGYSVNSDEKITDFINAISDINSGLLNSTFANFDSDVLKLNNSVPDIETTDPSELQVVNPRAALRSILKKHARILKSAKREGIIVDFLYDFLEKYADRVDAYKTATLDIAEGEGAPLGDLIANLRDTGDAGTDVLQNMTVNQMALKQVALQEEKADPARGYLPQLSILNGSEINSIRVLCSEQVLTSPEGDTTKVMFVGIPTSVFDKNSVDSEFCLKVSYTDIEYPQLVFRSKSYKFDKDLYILPDDIERAQISLVDDFSDVVDKIKYSKLRVEVIESEDASASITLEDDIVTLRVDNRNREIYTNLAVSETLKMYYRTMLGINMSETTLQSTPEGVNIPLSAATAQLARSMTSQISAVANYSGELASNLKNLVSDITTFENVDDFVDGELQPVDVALLGDLKNAYQSRIFSPELLRSRVLSAKMFDRIYAIPVDPDEFYVVPPGQPQVGDVSTPQEIFDFYLNGGIIEETGLPSPFSYKLAPRRSSEGSMALGSVTATLASVDNDSDTEEMLIS